MRTIDGFYIVLFLFTVKARVSDAKCTSAPPENSTMTHASVVQGQMEAYTCNNKYEFTTGDSVIILYCVDGNWQDIVIGCTQTARTSCTDPAPSDTTMTSVVVYDNLLYAYTCTNTAQAWLSGEPKRVSQCRKGSWVPIMDICDEICEIPRDCHEVEQLGFNSSDYYMVVPSGDALDTSVKVYCELSSTDYEGGHWTRILNNLGADMVDSTGSQYEFGYERDSTENRFIGLQRLYYLTHNKNGTIRPHVLEVKLTIGSATYFAAYDNFTVGNATDGYPITSLGIYHGNAGDGLCPHVHLPFSRDANNIGWWGEESTREALIVEEKGSLLTNASMRWEPLARVGAVTKASMRMRPFIYDKTVACPPMVGWEPYWTTTNGSWTLERNVSSIIYWNCIGDMIVEPTNKTNRGAIQCLKKSDGTFAWNDTIALPCRLECPSGFNASYDETRCYRFSGSTEVVTGLHQAAAKCMDLNASVAALVSGEDLYQAAPDVQYYTAHTGLGRTVVYPELPANDSIINCTDGAGCNLLENKKCLLIKGDGQATPAGCNEAFNYICQVPAYCPAGYVKRGGGCYMLHQKDLTLGEAEMFCNANGSSLAYPSSRESLLEMLDAVKMQRTSSSTTSSTSTYFVGINSRSGNFTAGNLYPGAANLKLTVTSEAYSVLDTASSNLTAKGKDMSSVTSNGAVCQWPGVIGCCFPTPELTANMTSNRTVTANYTTASFNETVIYDCNFGYFVNGNISLSMNQTLACLGVLGSWQPPLLPCIRVAVCEGKYPSVKSPGMTNVTDSETPYIGGSLTYTCPEGMGLANASDITNQTLTCTEDTAVPGTYDFFPKYQDCLACLGEPAVANATSDYDATAIYVYNTSMVNSTTVNFVTVTCNSSHEAAYNLTVQKIYCTMQNWNLTGILPCKMACLEDPPAPGANLTRSVVTNRWAGTVVTYTCDSTTYLEPNGTMGMETTANATCVSGVWEMKRGPNDLNCYVLVTTDPPVPPAGVNSTWVGNGTDNRREGAVVTYQCPDGKLFVNRTSTFNITVVNGTWTPSTIPICNTACLEAPPEKIGSANLSWSGLASWVDDVLTYDCPEGHATDSGTFNESITCMATGLYEPTEQSLNMTTLQETFVCEPACSGPPVDPPPGGVSDYDGNFTEGVVVEYTCPDSTFMDGSTSFFSNCTGGNWTLHSLPDCDVTTPSPTTASGDTLATPSPPYSETTDTHYPMLQNNMTDTDGINTTYTATDAPFGFGYAVLLESVKKQCLRQANFSANSGPACMADPNMCKNGLSFSIWERHTFTQDEFIRSAAGQLNNETDTKYVLSTGGDTKGHPGIAFYHLGVFQYVLVSTGAQYWELRVPGLMENGTWANIGIRWNPNVTKDTYGVVRSGGLELFINKKLEGRSYMPKDSAPAKNGLNPPELMLGCHRTNDSTEYKYFGDGEYDELATWKRPLADNETDYFLGGYMKDFSNLTPEQMSAKLSNVDLANPDTASTALIILSQMTQNHEAPTSPPDTTSSTALAGSSPTPSGPNSLKALTDAQNIQRRENLLDITERIFKESNIQKNISQSQADSILNGIGAVSNMMASSSMPEWKKMQENGSAGAGDLMWNSVTYFRGVFCNIAFTNGTKPIKIVKAFDNIIFYGQKMLFEDLKGRGKYVQVPDYSDEELKSTKAKWNQIFDMGRVMTNVFNDDHCDERPICLVVMVFDTYDDIGPCPVNIANIPGSAEQEMGSRLLFGSLVADKAITARGKVNYSAPLCEIDPFTMRKNPFYTKLENKVRVPAVRQLRFHSDEVQTKVNNRRCAYWNEKLSDFGAWDSDGCQVVESNEMYTKCTCEKFGPIIVLDEQIADPEIPPEPSWLRYVKLSFYALSAVLLVFYCIVVAYSSDLKEQFHLMGMYLSLSVLFGSIAMVVSDLDAVRSSRHLCTTIGTLTHFFYVAAGAWVACLGNASFKAITSGEVGGRLNAYSCIAWGVALFSVGVPYAFFVRDLGTDPRCFISWENNGKAAFFLPQVAFVCISFFFGVVVIFNLSTPALRKENLVDDYGSFCRGAAFVMIYFAITWAFGLVTYMRFDLTIDFYPLFQVLNSVTGIIIFIFIGLGSYRYRTVLVGKAKTRREKIKTLAGINKSKLETQPSPKKPKPNDVPERPPTASLQPPQPRGHVAGRPGSRPVTPIQ